MPFTSRSQYNTCLAKKDKRWDCDRWLKETPSLCCLPYRQGGTVKSRCMKNGERIIGKIQTGPRGGKYFIITERDKKGVVCTVKVYIKLVIMSRFQKIIVPNFFSQTELIFLLNHTTFFTHLNSKSKNKLKVVSCHLRREIKKHFTILKLRWYISLDTKE